MNKIHTIGSPDLILRFIVVAALAASVWNIFGREAVMPRTGSTPDAGKSAMEFTFEGIEPELLGFLKGEVPRGAREVAGVVAPDALWFYRDHYYFRTAPNRVIAFPRWQKYVGDARRRVYRFSSATDTLILQVGGQTVEVRIEKIP